MSLAAAMGAGSLAGCSGGSGGGSGGGSDKITVWSDAFDSQTPKLKKLMSDSVDMKVGFSDMRYDSIKKKYLTGAKTGTPDIVEATPNHRGDYVSAELIEPLTDRVDKLDYKDGYTGLDTMKYNGDIWALPYIGNGRGFVYRQDILKKYGFDVPDKWSDFVEMGAEITKKEDGMHGFTLTSQKGNTRGLQEFLSFLFQRVDTIFEPDGDEWKLVPTAEDFGIVFKEYFWDPFYKTDKPATDPNARGIDSLAHDIAYVNGNYAAISTGPWIPGLASGSDDTNKQAMKNYRNSVATHNPRVEGGEKGTYMEVKPVFLNKNSKSKGDAWKVVKAATSPEGIKTFLEEDPGNLPAHEDVEWKVPEQTNNPDWKGFKEVFKTGKSYGFWSVSKVSTTWFDLSQKVMYNDIDPMKAGKQLHEEWSSKAGEI
ncbi:type 2 periplasmic-binding domain-containing protein [Haladaptatus caseinilyticus]|uniref:ABC transporter substrate-binding protein n=1 Tax=Haladaptatus caseinilyticus TaxID=2993314 RepID=UPI00224A901E|nr:ABC transporter substrate-binding protein [Haladaptatus caseinilyticus]